MFLEYELIETELIWMQIGNSPVGFYSNCGLFLANVAYHYLLTVKFSGDFLALLQAHFMGQI